MTDDPLAAARRWRDADPDPGTRNALDQLLHQRDLAAIAKLFGTELEFGTAGLRGPMGPGPARMNRVVVRRAAAALAGHLIEARTDGVAPGEQRRPSVVVGHDARHLSERFALDVIEVLSADGIDVEHFDEPVPTPLLATAVVQRGACAGVMVTASHNPATDNGMKIYAADGAQIVTPTDRQIAARLRDLPLVVPARPPAAGLADAGSVRSLGGPGSGGRGRGALPRPGRRHGGRHAAPAPAGRPHLVARRRRRTAGARPRRTGRSHRRCRGVTTRARPGLPHRGQPEPRGPRDAGPSARAGGTDRCRRRTGTRS